MDELLTAGLEVNRRHHQRGQIESLFIQEDVEGGWDQLGASRSVRQEDAAASLRPNAWPALARSRKLIDCQTPQVSKEFEKMHNSVTFLLGNIGRSFVDLVSGFCQAALVPPGVASTLGPTRPMEPCALLPVVQPGQGDDGTGWDGTGLVCTRLPHAPSYAVQGGRR